jgi:hypothetical protein
MRSGLVGSYAPCGCGKSSVRTMSRPESACRGRSCRRSSVDCWSCAYWHQWGRGPTAGERGRRAFMLPTLKRVGLGRDHDAHGATIAWSCHADGSAASGKALPQAAPDRRTSADKYLRAHSASTRRRPRGGPACPPLLSRFTQLHPARRSQARGAGSSLPSPLEPPPAAGRILARAARMWPHGLGRDRSRGRLEFLGSPPVT